MKEPSKQVSTEKIPIKHREIKDGCSYHYFDPGLGLPMATAINFDGELMQTLGWEANEDAIVGAIVGWFHGRDGMYRKGFEAGEKDKAERLRRLLGL